MPLISVRVFKFNSSFTSKSIYIWLSPSLQYLKNEFLNCNLEFCDLIKGSEKTVGALNCLAAFLLQLEKQTMDEGAASLIEEPNFRLLIH